MANECSAILDDRGVDDCRARDCSRASIQLKVPLLFGLLFAQVLTGCGGGSGGASTVPSSAAAMPPSSASSASSATPSPLAAEAWQGHFIGTVKIGAGQYYGDALLTVDGAVRLYVGGTYANDGTVQQTRPASSAQFIGKVAGHANQASGSGVIIGQGCAAPVPGRLCGETAAGQINIAVDSGNIQGDIHVTTSAGDEIWSLALSDLNNYYVLPATPENVAGQYNEELAEFALDGDTIISVDLAGKLSFQSVHSGCIGNGTLTPHLDGKFNVYDVALTIENCNPPYAYLNGGFEGLATTTPSTVWDYDSLLRAWLSKRDGAPSPAAVTTLGVPM